MPIPFPTPSNHLPVAPAQFVMRNEGGASGDAGYCFVALTPITEQKDPENEMWNMYLDEVKEDDQRITDAWKEDANGLLVFTGLFSATVGAFVIEFYKKLSPDSGDQTVKMLNQFSQQFANYPNGNYSTAIVPIPSFTPTAPMVWVNAMWLISLVLSLTSALIATLLQQWARRYVETPKVPNEPNHRARVRWFLFLGTDIFKMRLLVEIAPTLLHLSVYMFFAGLVVVFHTINTNVAIAVDVSVGLFVLAYTMLSILPCIDVRCPYRTPMSYILWYPCHIFLSATAHCLHGLVVKLHGCFVEPNPGDVTTPWQHRFMGWLSSRQKAINKHWGYVTDGFGNSVIKSAINTQEADHKVFSYLFRVLSLSDKSKLRKLAASTPRHRILDLIRPVESGKLNLRDPLHVLLRSCEADTGATGPDEETRKRSLLLCLETIYDISKTPDVIPEFNFVRANYAKISLMRTLWEDSDTTIRVISRSICALIAKRVVGRSSRPGEEELRWLHEVIGDPAYDILNAEVETLDRMNFRSFVHGVLSSQVGDLLDEDAMSFRETLAILLNVETNPDFDLPFSQNRLSEEVRRLHRDDPEGSHEVVNKLLSMFEFIPPPSPFQTIPFPEPTIPGQSVSLPSLPTNTHAQ